MKKKPNGNSTFKRNTKVNVKKSSDENTCTEREANQKKKEIDEEDEGFGGWLRYSLLYINV